MTGTERKRLWRERQRQINAVAPKLAPLRLALGQERADILKSLRAEIRLKYSIAADHEINEVIGTAGKIIADLVQRGARPTLDDVKAHLKGKPLPKMGAAR